MTSMGAKKASKGRKRAVDEDNASQHTSASSDVMFFGLFRCVLAGLELLVEASGTLAGSGSNSCLTAAGRGVRTV